MSQTIKLKRSSIPGAKPLLGQLELGEIAINTSDGKVFAKINDGTEQVIEVAGRYFPTRLDDITAVDGVATYNLTKNASPFEASIAEAMLVSVNGVTQEPVESYTISGSTITFIPALSSTDVVDYIVDLGKALDVLGSLDYLQINTAAVIDPVVPGQIAWNPDEETINVGLNNDVTLQVGQETLIHVKAGEALSDGDVVYASGAVGNSGSLEVSKYIANNTIDERFVVGIATQDIALGEFGFVAAFGKVRGISTDGSALTTPEVWTDGTVLYASSAVPGELTSTPPEAPNQDIPIAFVLSASASNGTLFVRAYELGYHLNEIHDVFAPSPSNGDTLVWNQTNERWENTQITESLISDFGTYQPTSEKGAVNGYASLDSGGKVPTTQLPALALTDVSVVADETARLALTVEEGDVAIQSDTGSSYIYDGASWLELSSTETDPIFTASTVSNISNGTGFLKNNGSGTWSYDNSTYLTSYTETDTLQNVTTRGAVTTTNIEAASFTKTGATSDDVLLGDGTTTSLSGIGGGAKDEYEISETPTATFSNTQINGAHTLVPSFDRTSSTSPFTIEAWVNIPNNNTWGNLLHLGATTDKIAGFLSIAKNNSDNILISNSDGTGTNVGSNFYNTGNDYAGLGSPLHIAVSYDGTNTGVWLNGTRVYNGTPTFPVTTSANPQLSIFGYFDGSNLTSSASHVLYGYKFAQASYYDPADTTITPPTQGSFDGSLPGTAPVIGFLSATGDLTNSEVTISRYVGGVRDDIVVSDLINNKSSLGIITVNTPPANLTEARSIINSVYGEVVTDQPGPEGLIYCTSDNKVYFPANHTGYPVGPASAFSALGLNLITNIPCSYAGSFSGNTQFYVTDNAFAQPPVGAVGYNSVGAMDIVYYDNLGSDSFSLQDVTTNGATTSDSISITNATTSTSTTTGALIVTGGVGIAENLNIGGNVGIGGSPLGRLSAVSASETAGNIAVFGIDGISNGFQIIQTALDEVSYEFHDGSNNEVMVIDSTGKVGIGEANPQALLDVTGGSAGNTFAVNVVDSVTTASLGTQLDLTGFRYNIEHDRATGIATHSVGSNASVDAITILSTGNVGIGTTSPASTLEIAKADRVNGATLSVTNTLNDSLWALNDVIGRIDFRIDDLSTTQPVRGRIESFYSNGGGITYPSASGLAFYTAAVNTLSEAMRIDANGKVGIGQLSPAYTLDIKDPDGAFTAFNIEAPSDTERCIIGFSDSANLVGRITYQHNAANADVMGFTVAGTESVYINSSGNVGIGTSSPNARLQVSPSSATGDQGEVAIYLGNENTSGRTAAFIKNTTAPRSLTILASNGSADPEPIIFKIDSSTEAMRIADNGNVGIGDNNPAFKLCVTSNIDPATTSPFDNTSSMLRLENSNTSANSYTTITFSGVDDTGVGRHAASISMLKNGTWTAGSGNYSGSLIFSTRPTSGNQVERVRIDSSGRLGINNNNPTYTLDVKNTGSAYAPVARFTDNGEATNWARVDILNTNTTNHNGLLLYQDNNGACSIRSDNNGTASLPINFIAGGSKEGYFYWYNKASGPVAMALSSTGNLGIGENIVSPSGILHTKSSDLGVFLQTSATANKRMQIFFADSAGTTTARIGNDIAANNTSSLNFICGTGSTPQMTLNSIGNVEFKHGVQEQQYNLTGTDINPANGTIQYVTLTGNVTLTESLADGQYVTLMIDDGTGFTITWPTITWVGGTAPTLVTTGYNVIELWQVNSTLYGAFVGAA